MLARLATAFLYAVCIVLVICSPGESPSSTAPAPITQAFSVRSGVVLSHDAVMPTEIRIGNISAPVVPIKMTGNMVVPPSNYTMLGWWGKMAGSRHGVTLLTGHTVHTGGGALDHLGDVPVGTVADVSGIRYRVISNEPVLKPELARMAGELFEQNGKPRLVIVTCTGYDENTHEYSSNEVLIAVPIP